MPYLGYLHRMAASDTFILLDSVQYSRHDWENRNKVKTAEGPVWLTVPVKAEFGAPIPEVAIDNAQPWQEKHWRTLGQSYPRAAHFDWLCEQLRSIYHDRTWLDLMSLNTALTDLLCAKLRSPPRPSGHPISMPRARAPT